MMTELLCQKPLRVIIADDEPIARRGLDRMIRAEPGLEVAALCRTGREALDAIVAHTPHIAFLDVAMPMMSGLDVVRELAPAATPAVVFVTAFNRFAVDAFDVHAVDYLLKPFDAERLRIALARARARLNEPHGQARMSDLLELWDQHRRAVDQLTVRHQGRIVLVPVTDIDWVDAEDNYARLNVRGTRLLMRETMRSLELRLAPARFVRIHRSTIVNLTRVLELRPRFHGEYQVILRDGTRLTLSRGYRDALFARLARRD